MKNKKNCPNCGAPITTEICPYCHIRTGLKTSDADMEYPILNCKECHLNFWNVWFPLIFAFGFGFFGYALPIFGYLYDKSIMGQVLLFCSPFTIIGTGAFIIFLKSIIRNIIIKRKGKEMDATVYGYLDDNFYLNDKPAQVVKLLINTEDGPKFILYQLGTITHPFKINSKIKVTVYKEYFLVNNQY